MAPKVNCNPTKLANVLAYFHSTRVAHSIKDLEKALPGAASISGMQVKDYLQSLQDENQINVEKIGSGNWYWSFPGEGLRSKQQIVDKSREERDKLQLAVNDVQAKLDEATQARTDGDDGQRDDALATHLRLSKDVEDLKSELAKYADADPAIAEQRKAAVEQLKVLTEKYTDQILEMEQYFKDTLHVDAERLTLLKLELYGDEYEKEDEGLGELQEPQGPS